MFVYVLYDENGEIRYVGQTCVPVEKRLKEHLWPSALKRKGHKNNWLKQMLAKGEKPTVRAIQELSSIEELDAAEIYWISYFKNIGCPLTNDVAGGVGLRNPSPETRARMSAAKRGLVPWSKGKHLSEETKEKIRQANLGKKASEETKEKMKGADRSSYKLSEKGLANIRASKADWEPTSEQRENYRKAASARRRQVVDDLGNRYESITTAADSIGVKKSCVWAVANGYRKQVKGRTFSYVEPQSLEQASLTNKE